MNVLASADPQPGARPLLGRRGIAVFIILFWAAQFTLLTASRKMMMPEESAYFLVPRSIVTGVGIILSFGMAYVHQRMRGQSMIRRLIVAVLIALVGALLHSASNRFVFEIFMPSESSSDDFALRFQAFVQWFWAYAALSGLLLAVFYSLELGDNERRIAYLQRVAHTAQLRALRYQLNPHFMFNTLNSIAALIARKDSGAAEQMVENLADFLRAGLSLDPQEDITLDREIELQSLYLAIEALRFADRLQVTIDMPDDVKQALVPSLITQPLVENVVRHAVARSTQPVTLSISARREGDWLKLAVRNSAGDSGTCAAAPSGTGVGLANVADRLQARFEGNSGFRAIDCGADGFVVELDIPFMVAG